MNRRDFIRGCSAAPSLLVPSRFARGTSSQQVLLAEASGNVDPDPYFSSVVLLMHCQGTLSSSNFVDSTSRHTFTYNGSPTGPILTNTHLFDGQTACGINSRAVAQYQTIVSNTSDFSFGTADFTIEWMVWGTFTSGSGPYNGVFSTAPYATGGPPYGFGLQMRNDGLLQALENTGSSAPTNIIYWSLTGGNASAWNYVAIQRAGGSSMSCYYNGVLMSPNAQGAPQNRSYTNTTTPQLWTQYSDGAFATSAGALDGYFTEVRITKGVARYAGNYIPRTTPFPNS